LIINNYFLGNSRPTFCGAASIGVLHNVKELCPEEPEEGGYDDAREMVPQHSFVVATGVLQDGAFVIPSSTHIINYVESKFRGGNSSLNSFYDYVINFPILVAHRSLKPAHNSKEFDQMLVLEQAIARLPVGTLSLGSFIHDDLKLVPKAPFIGPVRQSCLSKLLLPHR